LAPMELERMVQRANGEGSAVVAEIVAAAK
jgi:hypothetical protein